MRAETLPLVSIGHSTPESVPLYHVSPGGSIVRILLRPPLKLPVRCEGFEICEWGLGPEAYPPYWVSREDLLGAVERLRPDAALLDGIEPLLYEGAEALISILSNEVLVGIRVQGLAAYKKLPEVDFAVLDFIAPGGAAGSNPPGTTLADNIKAFHEALNSKGVHQEIQVYILGEESVRGLRHLAGMFSRRSPLHIHVPWGLSLPVEVIRGGLGGAYPFVYVHSPVQRSLETFCPKCGYPIALREESYLVRLEHSSGRCQRCGEPIYMIGSLREATPTTLRRLLGSGTVWYHPHAVLGSWSRA